VQGQPVTIEINFDVSQVRLILLTLICSSPVILLLEGLIMQGLIAGTVAVALAIMARTLRSSESEFLIFIIRKARFFGSRLRLAVLTFHPPPNASRQCERLLSRFRALHRSDRRPSKMPTTRSRKLS
jgi:hypothetical protein